MKGNKPEVYRERNSVKVEAETPYKFKGSMEELLATYRDLCAKEPTADES